MACQVQSLDHIVLTVKSIEASVDFYSRWLGMRHEEFSSSANPQEKRHSLVFGRSKINLHLSGHEFEPKALTVQPGSADLCFITERPVEECLALVKEAKDVEIVELDEPDYRATGIVTRVGARGQLRSFYIRDPDGNLVEISNYVS